MKILVLIYEENNSLINYGGTRPLSWLKQQRNQGGTAALVPLFGRRIPCRANKDGAFYCVNRVNRAPNFSLAIPPVLTL